MRVFIAYELSEETLIYIRKLNVQLERFAKGRYVPESNMHLTLSFLGEISESRTQDLAVIMQKTCKANPLPEVSLQRLTAFSSVLAVTVKGSEALYSAERMLTAELDKGGFGVDSRFYRPHVTLVRDFTSELQVKEINKNIMIANRPQKTLALTLFQSVRTSGGAEYSPIYTCGLHETAK